MTCTCAHVHRRSSFERSPSRSTSPGPGPALASQPSMAPRRTVFAPSVVDPASSTRPTSHSSSHSSSHGCTQSSSQSASLQAAGQHTQHKAASSTSSSTCSGDLSTRSVAVKWDGPLSVRLASAAAACCALLVQQEELCQALAARLVASRLAVLVVRVVKEAEGAGKGVFDRQPSIAHD